MSSAYFAIASFTLLEALRNRLLWLLVVLLIGGFGLSEFIGEIAITEAGQFRSGFLGAVLRICAVVVLALFVITSVIRELNDKQLELVLSLPMTRTSYFLGKLLGFSLLGLLVAAVFSAVLMIYSPPLQALLWGLSLFCELGIVIAFSLLCLFTFNQVTAGVSAVMAFYVLARSLSAIQLMGKGPFYDPDALSQTFINGFISALAFVLPELDRFTSSEWLVYYTGHWTDLLPIAGQTFIYVLLLSGAALFDLYRKNL